MAKKSEHRPPLTGRDPFQTITRAALAVVKTLVEKRRLGDGLCVWPWPALCQTSVTQPGTDKQQGHIFSPQIYIIHYFGFLERSSRDLDCWGLPSCTKTMIFFSYFVRFAVLCSGSWATGWLLHFVGNYWILLHICLWWNTALLWKSTIVRGPTV